MSHVKINVCNKKLHYEITHNYEILSQSKMYVVCFVISFTCQNDDLWSMFFFLCAEMAFNRHEEADLPFCDVQSVVAVLEYVSRLRRGELLCIQRVRSRCLRGLHQSSSLTPALPHGPCSAMSSGDSPLRPSPGHRGPWHTQRSHHLPKTARAN